MHVTIIMIISFKVLLKGIICSLQNLSGGKTKIVFQRIKFITVLRVFDATLKFFMENSWDCIGQRSPKEARC